MMTIMMMMVVIRMMMTKIIFFEMYDGYKKRKAQKALIKGELLLISWHPSRYWDWCVSEDEKKRQKNCGIYIDLFVYGDQIQKRFDTKRLKTKMSSVLNVSNDSRKSEEFSAKDIDVLVESEEQNLFKRAPVGKFVRLEDIRTSLNGLEKCEILTRQELIPTRHGTPGWYGPRDQQNKMDKFLSFFGGMYVMMSVPTTL